jgi:tol-pal system protein YbgF
MGTDTLPIERPFRLAFAATMLVSLLACAPAFAQSTQKPAPPGQARAQPKDAAAATTPSGGDAALKQRVEQLEEQLVDMQVVVGTLESLARNGAASAPRKDGDSGGDGADSMRVDALETQVRAMAAQIEQLSQQVRALGGQPKRTEATPDALPSDTPLAKPGPGDAARFGSTTVTAGTGDAVADVSDSEQPAASPGQGEHASGSQPPGAQLPAGKLPPPGAVQDTVAAIAPPGTPAGNPKQLYETAYGYLMQRDYGAAQTAFEDFLNRYPKDSLAGNAQYWLGEAHFVRGEYKPAAAAFLKGYKDYAGNARAADSLLKLAMSLDRLGQKDGACSSYSELSTRFPDAPDNVKMRAKSERQRIGCP